MHGVDPAAVGLADFGRPVGFLARQLTRWHAQWQASETQPRPTFDQLLDRLTRELPEQSAPAIVHGDYRLTNVMFAPDYTRIVAVVDWEMATLGDPLTDIGLLHVYQALAQRENYVSPLMLPERGFLAPGQLVQRYVDASPRDVSRISWYVAFAYFKLAVISEGIHARYLAGKTVGAGFEEAGGTVPILLQAGLDALD